jgi:hypothetical protein
MSLGNYYYTTKYMKENGIAVLSPISPYYSTKWEKNNGMIL